MSAPTRYDLEFMADLLGIQAQEGSSALRIDIHYSTEELARLCAERAADPIANARAQRRLAALARPLLPLVAQLPDAPTA